MTDRPSNRTSQAEKPPVDEVDLNKEADQGENTILSINDLETQHNEMQNKVSAIFQSNPPFPVSQSENSKHTSIQNVLGTQNGHPEHVSINSSEPEATGAGVGAKPGLGVIQESPSMNSSLAEENAQGKDGQISPKYSMAPPNFPKCFTPSEGNGSDKVDNGPDEQ